MQGSRTTWHAVTSIPSGGPVLQAPLENGAMSGFPIKGCAFSKWVREIFATSPDSLGLGITGHSAKCTTLSWMSKLNCSELSRCIFRSPRSQMLFGSPYVQQGRTIRPPQGACVGLCRHTIRQVCAGRDALRYAMQRRASSRASSIC